MQHVLQAHREMVGRQIRKARKQAGLSHDRLAAATGTSRQHLIKLEKGQHLPGGSLLTLIARETGKSEEFFSSDDDEDEATASMPLARDLAAALHEEVRRQVDAALTKHEVNA